jgi:hypothetical protein
VDHCRETLTRRILSAATAAVSLGTVQPVPARRTGTGHWPPPRQGRKSLRSRRRAFGLFKANHADAVARLLSVDCQHSGLRSRVPRITVADDAERLRPNAKARRVAGASRRLSARPGRLQSSTCAARLWTSGGAELTHNRGRVGDFTDNRRCVGDFWPPICR